MKEISKTFSNLYFFPILISSLFACFLSWEFTSRYWKQRLKNELNEQAVTLEQEYQSQKQSYIEQGVQRGRDLERQEWEKSWAQESEKLDQQHRKHQEKLRQRYEKDSMEMDHEHQKELILAIDSTRLATQHEERRQTWEQLQKLDRIHENRMRKLQQQFKLQFQDSLRRVREQWDRQLLEEFEHIQTGRVKLTIHEPPTFSANRLHQEAQSVVQLLKWLTFCPVLLFLLPLVYHPRKGRWRWST